MLGLERNLGNCVDRWRAVPSDTSHYIQKVIPLYGVGHSVKIWARCADRIVKTLSLEYTFVAKNIPWNIQILPTITRPCTVSGANLPFNRPIQIWTMSHPF